MTAQQLKNSILQMAVQGKLVPQDPNDEPASVLLERIRAEKERLIKEKKIKREKNPSVIFKGADNTPYEKIGDEVRSLVDEVPFDVPDSWEWVTLKSIAISSLGKTLDKAKNKGELKPYLCSINVYWDGIDLTTVKEARLEEGELPKYLLKPGDLLICEGGDVGRSAVWESTQEMYYQNALHRVRFYGGINPYFFQLLLECYKGNLILDTYSKGMTIKHLVQTALNAIIFPLPPLAEQNRIVDAINRLLPFLRSYDRAEKRITALNTEFPETLKKSILQEAVQGKLVPQDPSDEPAEALLERIRAEKQRLIKEGKIKKDKHESVIFRRDNSHYEKLDGMERCIDDELPFEIPENWCWAQLGSISSYAETKQKINAANADSDIWGLDLEDIEKGGRLIVRKTVGERKAIGDKTVFSKGDILYSKLRPYLLKILVAPECGICTPEIVPFQMYGGIVSEYIVNFLRSPYVDNLINSITYGVKMPRVGTETMTTLFVPVPPLAEQRRIVQRIEELLPLVKGL